MKISTKDLLIDFYNYSEKQVIVDYPIILKDGSTFQADLILTTGRSIPYVIVFVTNGDIPVDQVKMILSQSSLKFGVVRQMKEDTYSEFWGIEKKTNIFTGKLEYFILVLLKEADFSLRWKNRLLITLCCLNVSVKCNLILNSG